MESQIFRPCMLRIYSNDDDKYDDGIIDNKYNSDDNDNNNENGAYTGPQVDADDNHPMWSLILLSHPPQNLMMTEMNPAVI